MPKLQDMLRSEANAVSNNMDIQRRDCKDVLISARFDDNHVHHILPEQQITNMLVDDLRAYTDEKPEEEVDEPDAPDGKSKIPKEIIFRNRQAFGDILTMTCAIRDFKKAFPQVRLGVQTTAMHIWDNNPYIDHTFRSATDSRKVLAIGPGFLTNKSNFWNTHMANAFRLDIQQKMNIRFPQGEIRPDIWLTKEEYNRKPLIDGPYWLFVYGGEPGWPVKQYHRWQEVINLLKDDINIVQIGVKKHPYPVLENVIDYVGKTEDRDTGIRDLFNLFLHAQGTLGLVSMHMHLAASFGLPSVVLAGAREPAWFTNYYGHQYIQTNGTLPCAQYKACWKCKMKGCVNQVTPKAQITKGHHTDVVPKCVDIIEPEEIAEGVRKYYKGGRLEYGKKIPNTFFQNIVKEKKVFTVPKTSTIDNELLKKYGFEWGGGSITDKDWIFLKDIIAEYGIKSILEFGAGLSSLLFATKVDKVITFETQQGWIDKMNKFSGEKNFFIPWDGKNLQLKPEDFNEIRFDFAFVDGPAGGVNREHSTKYASQLADLIVVHDAGRQAERMWQEKYLAKDFTLVAKGGHRCHFWVKNEICKVQERRNEAERIKTIENDDRKSFRMITTCRGFGGSERSSIFIMRDMISRGYRVELFPTGNVSGEYKANIPKEVMVRPWNEIRHPVDLCAFYTSDCVFNFKAPQYAIMDQLKAKRKVMILNYQLGGAGQFDWTKDWDLYMFLNSTKEGELLKRLPDVKTQICPPPTDLTEFFKIEPKFDGTLRLIRHNSQRDAKHPSYTNDLIIQILEINEGVQFFYMPAYTKTFEHANVHKFKVNQVPVPQFLSYGNCFWYHLPPGYQDQGPRVILEAMACGMPCIGDNSYGAKDRITPETGWLCDDVNDYLEVIKEIVDNPDILRIKGEAARERAKEHFVPERWADFIIGE